MFQTFKFTNSQNQKITKSQNHKITNFTKFTKFKNSKIHRRLPTLKRSFTNVFFLIVFFLIVLFLWFWMIERQMCFLTFVIFVNLNVWNTNDVFTNFWFLWILNVLWPPLPLERNKDDLCRDCFRKYALGRYYLFFVPE